jgi:hypothetical protein
MATSMLMASDLGWSEGEHRVHTLLNVPEYENPTSPFLSPFAAHLVTEAPIMAVGVLDADKRPWTSIWGGEKNFSRPLGGNFLGIRSDVNASSDPVVEILTKGSFGQGTKKGPMFSGLAVDLATRRRVKVFGRVVGGKLSPEDMPGVGDLQLAVKVEQSLGRCAAQIMAISSLTVCRSMSKVLEQERNTSSSSRSYGTSVGAITYIRWTDHLAKSGYMLHI